MKENGLLLVNLGSPRSTNVSDVRQYLAEFLGDPNVIEMPRWFWKPILHGMILRSRPAKSAQLYREIWTDAGSPLIVHTYNLTKKVRTLLPDWEVAMAMTYGQPTIASQIAKLQQKCRHITVLPLFPHYSKSTTKSIINQVAAVAPNATIIKRFEAMMPILRFWLIRLTSCGQQATMINCLFPITEFLFL